MSREKLTSKQKRLVAAIENYTSQHGSVPTYRELMVQLGYRSTGSIYRFVQSLKKKGIILDAPRSWRSVQLATTPREDVGAVVSVDVIGQVSRKKPPELLPKTHRVDIPRDIVGGESAVYGLVIQDASFLDEHLLPGDLILVEPVDTISPGELVLASTQKSIIGHFFEEGVNIRFRSNPYASAGSPSSLVVRADEVQIWGIVVGIIRAAGLFPHHSHPEQPFFSPEQDE